MISADGDADRPLLMAVKEDGTLCFIPGDILGMLAAEVLKPDAVVVPISCNDAIDRSPLATFLRRKTKIGSPYVIAGLNEAKKEGAVQACGWESNGGFILGTNIDIDGQTLYSLPTRDTALPIIATLIRAKSSSLMEMLGDLPRRFGATALLKEFPRSLVLRLMEMITPRSGDDLPSTLITILAPAMTGEIERIDTTDGIRVTSRNGEVVHLRPSGNGDESRVYAVADEKGKALLIAERMGEMIAAFNLPPQPRV